jgi:hypothetical protein
VIRVWVRTETTYDNRPMDNVERTDLLPCVLVGLVVLIMGIAVVMDSDGPHPESPPSPGVSAPEHTSASPQLPPPATVDQPPAETSAST